MSAKPKEPEAPAGAVAEEAPAGTAFLEAAREIEKGNGLHELDTALADLVAAVRRTGGKGRITYTLEVAAIKSTDGAQVTLADEVKVKLPTRPRRPSIFFTTRDNGLSRNDPGQLELDIFPTHHEED